MEAVIVRLEKTDYALIVKADGFDAKEQIKLEQLEEMHKIKIFGSVKELVQWLGDVAGCFLKWQDYESNRKLKLTNN